MHRRFKRSDLYRNQDGLCIRSAFSLSAQAAPPDLANEGSIAEMFDHVLEKEFAKKKKKKAARRWINGTQRPAICGIPYFC